MKIIESFKLGKRETSPCEDGWVVTDDFAAVVDGSTAKIQIAAGQESPGHLAMRLVCEAIRQLPTTISCEEALKVLTQVIADDRTYVAAHYRPTCSAVIYSDYRKEIWYIGDCQSRCNGQTTQFKKPVDDLLIGIRCQVIRYCLQHGYTEADIKKNDRGRAFIYDALCDQLHFQNDPDPHNPYRYPVVDGQPIAPELVPILSVGKAKELILASDGYPELFDTLAESEQALEEILRKDPLCINENPSSKCMAEGNRSFDDRTYLRLGI